MELLNFKEVLNGWWLAIKFFEKGSDRKNIIQAVFYPKIDNERSMKNFFNNHLNTTHNFGEIILEGVVRTMPQEIRERHKDSMFWERQREAGKVVGNPGSNDKYRHIQEEVSFMRMGINNPLVKKYPKTYVKTKSGWVPDLLRGHYSNLEKAQKAVEMEKKFNDEFREGMKSGNVMEVLKRWTVPLEKEAETEKEYEPMEVPVFAGYDESCGQKYKEHLGLFDYGRISTYMGIGGKRKEYMGEPAKTLTR